MKKITKQDVMGSYIGLSNDERAFVEKNADVVCEIINKAFDGILSKEDVDAKFKTLDEQISSLKGENTDLKTKNDQLHETVKKAVEALEKAKQHGVTAEMASKFIDKFNAMMDSKQLEDFNNKVEKKTGWFGNFTLKEISAISSIENNYDGDVLLSRQSDVVANPYMSPRFSVREIIRTIPGDPKQPQFTYLRVAEFDRNARYETENGRLAQSNLKYKEVTCAKRRVGSSFDLSKDLLLARVQLRAFLISQIPGIITQAENAGILFGDGTKNQLTGITNTEGVGSIESQITATIVSGTAGNVKKIETHSGGKNILVEFDKPVSLANSSMMITFTGAAVNTDLNSAHSLIKINDHQFIVVGAAYNGAETATATMTYTINHSAFKSVESPNTRDVIGAIYCCLSFAQYAPNAVVLNPMTVFAIETEKDTTGRPLDLIQVINGRKYIGGMPLVETTDIPVGMYLAGDFQNGANLYDYSKLEMQFAEDAETVLYNMVRLWFQEQLGLVIYMPWAFAYGSIEALRTAITKPAANND